MFCIVPYQVTTLLPPWLLDPMKGPYWVKKCFQELLSDAVLGYEPSLGGVILAYGHIRLPQNAITLVDYTPFAKATCHVKVLLFKLKPGQRLIGRVTFVGEDQISLQVFGVFPAVITVDNGLSDYAIVDAVDSMPTRGRSELRQGTVEEDHGDKKVGIGSWIRFEVLRVQLGASERLFLLHGTLKETRDQPTEEEKLGLVDEEQVERVSIPNLLPSKGKGRRHTNRLNKLESSQPFSFGYHSLGDPLLDNDTPKSAVHQYFEHESPEQEERVDDDRYQEDASISQVENETTSIVHPARESEKERKKHSKKHKKHEKKKHKKDKRKTREEDNNERNHKRRRKNIG
ncbi:hypothetical protein GpartN1_g5613.t1 [Galdieria partita]|uniref:DNA-directed RNA polymerase I subunit RPA43 n=1 Tax=Galdieria partita TaxID=83374 RepID=A0A9C7USM6_9RHOD|nr:hypothetical protein GpartN1_g5613.t1 [Galdieria partita]